MFRTALLFSPLLLVACATTRTNDLIAGDALDSRATHPSTGSTPEAIPEIAVDPSTPSPASAPIEPSLERLLTSTAPVQEGGLHGDRFTIKGGYLGSTEDALDDGYIVDL